MKTNSRIRAIGTADEFAEHIRQVEAYIAGDDPETKLMQRLSDQIDKKGEDSLTKPERLYFAASNFIGALFNGLTHDFLANQHELLINSVRDALVELQTDDLVTAYDNLRREFHDGVIQQGSDYESKSEATIIAGYMDLDSRLESYAFAHRLFD